MANNIDVKDAAGVTKTMKTTDNVGVHTAHHIVDSSALPTGAATETTLASIDTKVATQTTLAAIETLLSGTITVSGTVAATQSGTWNITNISGTVSLPTGAATETTLATLGTEATLLLVESAVDGIEALLGGTISVSAVSLPLPAGAATAALQTQPGVDIGDVTINNASGASAVNIQDGGNSITVDGTVAASQSGTWNIGSITTLPSIPAGTNNIGDVDVLSLPGQDIGFLSEALRKICIILSLRLIDDCHFLVLLVKSMSYHLRRKARPSFRGQSE